MQFDLITCNPPWIPAEFVAESSPLDNGVFDPKETFLQSALNFASKRPSFNTYQSFTYLRVEKCCLSTVTWHFF